MKKPQSASADDIVPKQRPSPSLSRTGLDVWTPSAPIKCRSLDSVSSKFRIDGEGGIETVSLLLRKRASELKKERNHLSLFVKMKRFLLRRAFSSLASKRSYSGIAAAEAVASHSDEYAAVLQKMPPFDYTPPPYDGPRAAEILSKRNKYLSPSLFHFYTKPVRILFLFFPFVIVGFSYVDFII
jgi:hypothetical protein